MADLSTASAQTLEGKGRHFNINKLQAVLCMAASAAVSITLLAWVILR